MYQLTVNLCCWERFSPDHAMAAEAKGSGDERVYGFYDPNAGII
ncbi:hypothetical protein [Vibrio splendidus]